MDNGIPVSTYWAFAIGAAASIITILITVFTTSEYPPTSEELKNIENFVFSFDKNFMKIVQGTDFCITRAGASTLAELSILNIPFLAIPLPSSKDNHQLENAKFYKDINCCWVLDQKFFKTQINTLFQLSKSCSIHYRYRV